MSPLTIAREAVMAEIGRDASTEDNCMLASPIQLLRAAAQLHR